MSDYDTILLPVFNELRRLGVPLGLPEYFLAVKSIREGVGLTDLDSLKRFCRLLWTKSQEDQRKFDVVFEKLVGTKLRSIHDGSAQHLTTPSSDVEDNNTSKLKRKLSSTKRVEAHILQSESSKLPDKPVDFYKPVKYHFTPRLPLDKREMTSLWRHLRNFQREGIPEELDVEGTIDRICQTGFFLGPMLQPRRRNQVRLLILIDQLGSMSPFSLLIEAFIASIAEAGLSDKSHTYYFHDCPESVLYEHPNLTLSRPLTEALEKYAKSSAVLIVSDAGAAHGYYNVQRVASTRTFLKILSKFTYLYTWLNPMPIKRWETTTAEDIARDIPMFHLDRNGLNDAINILRGHPFPPEVSIDA